MSITTKQIAVIAKVSQSTVSRCLNDSPLISRETKLKIMKIAKEHGFQFNTHARSLSANKTYTVGVIFPKGLFDSGFVLHFRSWQDQLIESLERMELDVIVSFSVNRFTKQNNIRRLVMTKKVDGLIILEPNLDDDTIELLEKGNTPFVFCKYVPSFFKTRGVDLVCVDQFKGGFLAGNHLIKLGHRKIMCISAKYESDEFELRTQGFREAFRTNSLEFNEQNLVYGVPTFHSGYQVIMDNQDMLKDITALFAQNDLMALGAISALQELGFGVPNDIAVIGFDDVDLCTFYKPHLTTIRQPTNEIAEITCKRLVEMIESKQVGMGQQLVIQPRLIVRQSCGGKQ